jgi:hypothetical protein
LLKVGLDKLRYVEVEKVIREASN